MRDDASAGGAATDGPPADPIAGRILIGAIFLLAICGLVYELIAGALSSYLLGDSITQFSVIIGLFLSAMGLGSFLSQRIYRHLLAWLISIEIGVGIVGGSMALIGFAMFSYTDWYGPVLLTLVGIVGVLVGLEIPLVIRILRDHAALRVTLANVLSADYLGALVASVLFPFCLLPFLGLVQAGLVMGLANVGIASIVLWRVGPRERRQRRGLAVIAILGAIALSCGIVWAGRLVSHLESRIYQDEIIYAATSRYQRIIVTRWREDVRLYLDGHLQFSSVDEYRYHETLVHPAMSSVPQRRNVLILGGGDGMTAREVLKYADVETVDVVDLDSAVTDLFRTRTMFTALNDNALNDPRVRVHNQDAFQFVNQTDATFDVILMDLPDPSGPELGKLYSQAFFGLARRRLAPGGVIASQCTSPFRSRSAFWCIVRTLESATLSVEPEDAFEVRAYHAHVPTFGTWGFCLAGRALPGPGQMTIGVATRFLTTEMLPALFVFPPDMAMIDTPINRLNDPVIGRLYRSGYHRYFD